MMRRSVTHLLLSLLLLLSQQFAVAHVISHWSAQVEAPARIEAGTDDGELSRAIAQHQSCDQCLAFAQLAAPLGQQQRTFVPPALRDGPIFAAAAAHPGARAPCPFQSRAPPAIA